eukprot:2979625-Amphidinium_carterae.2
MPEATYRMLSRCLNEVFINSVSCLGCLNPYKTVKTVALPDGAFKVAGATLPVRSMLVMGAPGVALAQDTAAVLQEYKRLQDSQQTQVLITSAKGKNLRSYQSPSLKV